MLNNQSGLIIRPTQYCRCLLQMSISPPSPLVRYKATDVSWIPPPLPRGHDSMALAKNSSRSPDINLGMAVVTLLFRPFYVQVSVSPWQYDAKARLLSVCWSICMSLRLLHAVGRMSFGSKKVLVGNEKRCIFPWINVLSLHVVTYILYTARLF
ncbi:hypothetical protein F5Y18DRAFT_375944 [Xylariaceae sp. FL1019]|nr:hypothetical protein F5Y18DRAFT_375944 [Xylariaceae sp. FL1019]